MEWSFEKNKRTETARKNIGLSIKQKTCLADKWNDQCNTRTNSASVINVKER